MVYKLMKVYTMTLGISILPGLTLSVIYGNRLRQGYNCLGGIFFGDRKLNDPFNWVI